MINPERTEFPVNRAAIEPLPLTDAPFQGGKIRSAYLEVMYGCNYRCSYCYVGPENKNPIIPAASRLATSMGLLREAGVSELIMLGGEPTLHPAFTELCDSANELGFSSKGIVTNGSAMTAEKADALARNGFWVDVTFRGSDDNTFDAVTGKAGTFQKAVEAAEMLTQRGVSVGVEYDCIPENYLQLYGLMELLAKRGIPIKQIQLHRIMPEGDAKEHPGDFSLNLEQWQEVFSQARSVQDTFGTQVIMEDGFPLCLTSQENWDMITLCSCGFTHVTVAPNGDVRDCTVQKETLGNIYKTPLAQIASEKLHMDKEPAEYPDPCNTCAVVDACRGGCEASGKTQVSEAIDVFHDKFVPIKDIYTRRPQVIINQQIQAY